MSIFDEKLSRLVETIRQVAERGATDLAAALEAGRGRVAVAIGSGGSYVTAHYIARCRSTLGFGPTIVMTAMEFVLSMDDWADAEIWLVSAGANNADIAAAFRSAVASRSSAVRLLTVKADGATAIEVADHPRSEAFVMPVADPKDGFLATHSMVAMITALLIAADRVTERPHGRELAETLLQRAQNLVSVDGRHQEGWFRVGDTVVLLHDPQVAPVAALIETSLWETAIAPVQRTDFRNFAHGRHVWAARHPDAMFVMALTTCESVPVWSPIAAALPPEVRSEHIDLGDGGRFANAVGIIEGLIVISRMGKIAGIDPGRPGRGPFAEAIYENDSLNELARGMTPAVRHKAVARLLHDPIHEGGVSLCVIGKARLRDLGAASFVGLALDYDGTVVPNQPTEARLGPPSKEVMDELVRLVDGGVQVGFATGRGHSAGGKLRESLPERIHSRILMGYYNGAHIRTLDVDIRDDPPAEDDRVSEVARWISASGLLQPGSEIETGRAQVTIDHSDVLDPTSFAARLGACPAVANGGVRVLRSHHSFDIVPAGTTKLKVVEALVDSSGQPAGLVLGIGDSGSPLGNDRELLSGQHCISVSSVCGSHQGSWTLFGSDLQGPEALARILRAANAESGCARIDMASLGLD